MILGRVFALLKCCILLLAVVGCAGEDKSWEEDKAASPDERPEYQQYMESGRYGPSGPGKDGGQGKGPGGGGHGGR